MLRLKEKIQRSLKKNMDFQVNFKLFFAFRVLGIRKNRKIGVMMRIKGMSVDFSKVEIFPPIFLSSQRRVCVSECCCNSSSAGALGGLHLLVLQFFSFFFFFSSDGALEPPTTSSLLVVVDGEKVSAANTHTRIFLQILPKLSPERKESKEQMR